MASSPYREQILDHYINPRGKGHLAEHAAVGEVDNPVCGDVVRLELHLDAQGQVDRAAFDGQGCILSMAAASMLTEYIQGRSLADLQTLTDDDMLGLLGVELGPVRVKCALLPLRALEAALEGMSQ
jgi:nitrogen fixation NifU-like protein